MLLLQVFLYVFVNHKNFYLADIGWLEESQFELIKRKRLFKMLAIENFTLTLKFNIKILWDITKNGQKFAPLGKPTCAW